MLSWCLRYRVVVLKTVKDPQTEEVASNSIVLQVCGEHTVLSSWGLCCGRHVCCSPTDMCFEVTLTMLPPTAVVATFLV